MTYFTVLTPDYLHGIAALRPTFLARQQNSVGLKEPRSFGSGRFFLFQEPFILGENLWCNAANRGPRTVAGLMYKTNQIS